MKATETSALKVSATTAKFIDALAALKNAQEIYLVALQDLYGEDQGEKFFLKSTEAFDATKDEISRFLTLAIEDRLSDLSQPGII